MPIPKNLPKLYSTDSTDQCVKCGKPGTKGHPLTRVGDTWRCATDCRG